MRDLLAGCGAEEFIPVFAKRNITFKQFQYMEDKELKEVRDHWMMWYRYRQHSVDCGVHPTLMFISLGVRQALWTCEPLVKYYSAVN